VLVFRGLFNNSLEPEDKVIRANLQHLFRLDVLFVALDPLFLDQHLVTLGIQPRIKRLEVGVPPAGLGITILLLMLTLLHDVNGTLFSLGLLLFVITLFHGGNLVLVNRVNILLLLVLVLGS